MMSSRTTRKEERDSTEIKVEQVFLEQEQGLLEDEMDSGGEDRHKKNFDKRTMDENKSKANRIQKGKQNRYTQVNADELDQSDFDCKVPSVPGENAPIVGNTEDTVPQCRLCLRRVSQANLKVIFNKHKAKVLAAFRLKIYVNDAYPFACRNCLNLIDIFLDFRQIVMKSKNLLLTQRAYLESEGWDESNLMETIANCQVAVEQNRKNIDLMYEKYAEPTKRKRESYKKKLNLKDDSPSKPATKMEVHEKSLKLEAPDEQSDIFNAAEMADAQLLENTSEGEPVIKRERDEEETIQHHSGNESDNYSGNDVDDDDEDYTPGVNAAKSKLSIKSNSDSDESMEDDVAEEKPKSKQKKGKRQYRSRGEKRASFAGMSEEQKQQMMWDYKHQLCDFCGETVTCAAAEAHKNRHLGIKPYKCPVAGCDLTFHSKNNQASHVKRLHSETGMPTMECNICGQFIRGGVKVLNYHKKRHTEEKRHVCTVCGKGFTMKWYLRQHSIVHSGEFPHKCSYCGKRFNNKWSMKTHEKNIHEKKNNFPVEQYPTTSYNTSWDQNVSLASEDQFQNNMK